jgi:hypothetical protein
VGVDEREGRARVEAGRNARATSTPTRQLRQVTRVTATSKTAVSERSRARLLLLSVPADFAPAAWFLCRLVSSEPVSLIRVWSSSSDQKCDYNVEATDK